MHHNDYTQEDGHLGIFTMCHQWDLNLKVVKCIVIDKITSHRKWKQLPGTSQHGLLSVRFCITNLLNAVNLVTQSMAEG